LNPSLGDLVKACYCGVMVVTLGIAIIMVQVEVKPFIAVPIVIFSRVGLIYLSFAVWDKVKEMGGDR